MAQQADQNVHETEPEQTETGSARQLLPGLAILLFSIVVSLFLAEGLVRLADSVGVVNLAPTLADIPTPEEIEDQVSLEDPGGNQPLYIGDDRFHHQMMPNWSGFFPDEIMEQVGRANIPIRINSIGLRSPEVLDPKPAGSYRILILGDSVTFGWGVRGEDTFPSQLASLLATLSPDQGFEVINAGVSGYSTWQEALWLDANGMDLKPDVVVVQLHLNDAADNLWGTLGWDRGGEKGLARYSMLARLAQRVLSSNQAGSSDEPCGSDWKIDSSEVCWDRTTQLLDDIQATVTEQDVPLVLLVSPMRWQIDTGIEDSRTWIDDTLFQEAIGDRAAQNGWIVVDPLPAMRAASGPDLSVFLDMGHPSEEGHRLMAQELFSGLSQAGLLP
ncbi:MAG: SGNH/GDSL hydrolase family protein [Chloroflexota bacterium]|nr:SGNH/GDSL hydrolase family protein [Chloroflexota bacterium]